MQKPLFAVRTLLCAGLIASALTLVAAGATPVLDAVDEALQTGLWEESKGAGRVADLTVPFLSAPALEKRWDRPVLTVVRDGSYVLRYANPKNAGEFVKIVGTNRAIPVIRNSAGRPAYDAGTVRIVRTPAPFFRSGNEDPEIMTSGLRLKAPDGRSASYVIRAGGSKAVIERNLAAIAWSPAAGR